METNNSPQLAAPTVEAVVGRLEIASRILAGLCANPSVIAHNHNCGWSLVNCTDADLAGYAVSLADALIAADANTPNPEGLRTRHLVEGTQHPLVVAPNPSEK